MTRRMSALAVAVAGWSLAACSSSPPASPVVTASPSSGPASPSAVAVASPGRPTMPPIVFPSPRPQCETAVAGEIPAGEQVPANANIFAAGREAVPAPGGGGGGTLPPGHQLPAGTGRVLTFPLVMGCVCPIMSQVPYNGPEGDRLGPTRVQSYKGISGISHGRNGMFLVGVFLTDEPPSDPAPEALDFTEADDFVELAPEIGQTFFVGGGHGRRFLVPDDATRLFLGFADAEFYVGPPGWYGNNVGALQVRIAVDVP